MDTNSPLQQMLIEAMTGQKRSVRAYELMVSAANSAKDKELLNTIRREERRHYYFLEGLYEDLTGTASQSLRTALSFPKQYQDMLKTAICDKLETIDFMEQMTEQMNCAKQKEIMGMIMSDQREHARVLAAIYDKQG